MIVVDTHIKIWDALHPERLSQAAKDAISVADDEDGIIICDISLWEIAMPIKKGRVKVDASYQVFIDKVLESRNYFVQEINKEIAECSVNFSDEVNKDPADRIISATSVILKAPLVSADENLNKTDEISTIW